MGITEISWNSSTENEDWPADVLSWPRSFRLWMTIAVDDMARMRPAATAAFQSRPMKQAASAMDPEVPRTCNPPNPRMGLRRDQSFEGCNSSPTMNNIM